MMRTEYVTLWPALRKQVTRPVLLHEVRQFVLLFVGIMVVALGYAIFQIPYHIAAGGLSGVGIILNHFTGWSEGAIYFVLNVPLLVLGFFYLGRWPFVLRTLLAVVLFSVATEIFVTTLPLYLPEYPITEDVFLSAVYAGLVSGIGIGFIYRAGATIGGTGIVGRILQMKTGTPLSQVYLYTDGLIVLTAGVVFGWELALYAMLTLLLSGMMSDYVLEGPSRARTATIITNEPLAVTERINTELGRGATYWTVTGAYTGQTRTLIQCTVYRPQVADLKRIVMQTDPCAFVSIGVTQQAMGEGFSYAQHTA